MRDHHQTHQTHIEPIGGLGLALLGDCGQQWPKSKGRGKNLKERETWETKLREWESQEQMREKNNKIIILFLQLSYSVILHIELHCSIIANFFLSVIVGLYKSRCVWSFELLY